MHIVSTHCKADLKLYLSCLSFSERKPKIHLVSIVVTCCLHRRLSAPSLFRCSCFVPSLLPSLLSSFQMHTLFATGSLFAEANQLQVEASFHCTCSCFLIKSESGKSLWSLKSCRQLPSSVVLSCQATIRPQSTLLFALSTLSSLYTSLDSQCHLAH